MKKGRSAISGIGPIFVLWMGLGLMPPADASAAVPTWVNPKEAIGPDLARFQQGKKELTALEKEEIRKYGYTALEVMTYVDSNRETRGKPGFTVYHRCINVTGRGGNIRDSGILQKYRFYYPNYGSRIKQEGIKPGGVEYRYISLITGPAETKGDTSMRTYYLAAPGYRKDSDNWQYSKKTRKVTRNVAANRQDEGMMITTRDDDEGREPWDEDHRILGEDLYRGNPCLVVESVHRAKGYYLAKRVIWVEKTNFLDLHEEQFDHKGHLFKLLEKDWFQVKPSNYWFPRETNSVKLPMGRRTIHQTPIYIVHEGPMKDDYNMQGIRKQVPWVQVDGVLPPVTGSASLPPEPQPRLEFWERMGLKIQMRQ
ncbi:MAG: outer membrane lipoprotein-sorting protein [Candidatus Tectomicrobia bacterium]|uniref:Outer membrane lipoprotein-sorting protein n=1 Tax=Tectimicrobiota bacterium TaxID=2528274 RepID=A0A932FWG2_UNCTE|nr:outer membrane lipoprotein-sorting protein [Candidatus Tectomicrobia bacterium]